MEIQNKKKILVIGCGGSGKTTLALRLGDILDIPVVHLDWLWFKPNWKHVSHEEFDAKLKEELQKESWIMDGEYRRTLPLRLEEADLVIYLDFNRLTCIRATKKRIKMYAGKKRRDLPEGCIEELSQIDRRLTKHIWDYPRKRRPEVLEILKQTDVPIVTLRNYRQVEDFLASIELLAK